MSFTVPMPSQRGHWPPRATNSRSISLPVEVVAEPVPETEGMLNENACGGP